MTVGELMMLLEEMPEDAEVRIAEQPSYPFENAIADVVEADNGMVYIAEGRQINYLCSEATEALTCRGWCS